MSFDKTIVAFNDGQPIACLSDTSLVEDMSCCDLYGNGSDPLDDWFHEDGCVIQWYPEADTTNACVDPEFCNVAHGNLYLKWDSPCQAWRGCDEEMGALRGDCSSYVGVGDGSPLPEPIPLVQLLPNPSAHDCNINYVVPGERWGEHVRVEIYDMTGRVVRRLVDAPQRGGHHRVNWDHTDQNGMKVPGGAYYCRLSTNSVSSTSRLILVE